MKSCASTERNDMEREILKVLNRFMSNQDARELAKVISTYLVSYS